MDDQGRDPLAAFSDLEREVVALAAASSWECAGVSRNPFLRLLNGLIGSLDRDAVARPLANERLEALRGLACITFATGGRPAQARVDRALERGVLADQVEALVQLSARQEKAPTIRPRARQV